MYKCEESSTLSQVSPMSATSYFSNQHVNICLGDNRKAYQIYFSTTQTITAKSDEEDDEYGGSAAFSPVNTTTTTTAPADVDRRESSLLYFDIGDIYEQISYV